MNSFFVTVVAYPTVVALRSTPAPHAPGHLSHGVATQYLAVRDVVEPLNAAVWSGRPCTVATAITASATTGGRTSSNWVIMAGPGESGGLLLHRLRLALGQKFPYRALLPLTIAG